MTSARGGGRIGSAGMTAFVPWVRTVTPSQATFEREVDVMLGRIEPAPISLPSLGDWGADTKPEVCAHRAGQTTESPSVLHDAVFRASPLQRHAAQEHRARMQRIANAATKPAAPAFDPPPPAENPEPPIPNTLMALALEQIETFKSIRTQTERVQRAVLAHYPDVTLNDLKSARRTANVVRPRQLAMYMVKTLTERSLPDIGRRFGNRDHTTVLHAVRKIKSLLPTDPVLAAQVSDITFALSEETI